MVLLRGSSGWLSRARNLWSQIRVPSCRSVQYRYVVSIILDRQHPGKEKLAPATCEVFSRKWINGSINVPALSPDRKNQATQLLPCGKTVRHPTEVLRPGMVRPKSRAFSS